ncbi:MAG: MFS transporter [Holosporales bacterium]|jgi:PAT family beta-lactamase induction signal transducer AmpG|nr:MFS transporter [Holosporales bacterium]
MFFKTKTSTSGSFLSPKVWSMMFVGFAAGLPFLMTLSLLDIWLKQSGASYTLIGMFAICHWPFMFKFLISPFIDKFDCPYFSHRLGRKRGWVVASQLAIFAGLCGISLCDPTKNLVPLAIFANIVALAYGCLDIALYSYQVDRIENESIGPRASMITFGFRLGMLTASSGGLYLSYYVGWHLTYFLLGCIVVLSTIPILLLPEPERGISKERRMFTLITNKFEHNLSSRRFLTIKSTFFECLICPFKGFKRHPQWFLILFIIATFKIGDVMAHKMAKPMYLELGFSTVDIAKIVTAYGMIATITGGFIGGLFIRSRGLLKVMFFTGAAHLLATLLYMLIYCVGYDIPLLCLITFIVNATGGMMMVGFMSMLYGLCRTGYPATQFAIFWAIYEFCGMFFRSLSGMLVDNFGWIVFYLITMVLSVPSLIAIKELDRTDSTLNDLSQKI